MKFYLSVGLVVMLAAIAEASWYWPFGDDESSRELRLSEMMEPASELIDEASDLAGDGKTSEAVEKYREALAELDRIERENPDRVKKPEFATLRNKRAYVNAAIDAMLMNQVKANAKPVAVSDTTELEKRLAAERAEAKGETKSKDETKPKDEAKPKTMKKSKDETEKTPAKAAVKAKVAVGGSLRDQVLAHLENGNYAEAERTVEKMLQEKPNNATALNLKAAVFAEQGIYREAENALDQAIMSNPRNYYAYYNMAELELQRGADRKPIARRYYETGRAVGGPVDDQLELKLK